MNQHDDERPYATPRSTLLTAVIVLLCLCIGGAVLHANLSHQFCYVEYRGEGSSQGWSVGWPVVYGGMHPEFLGGYWATPSPKVETISVSGSSVPIDVFVGALLIISPAVILRLRRSGSVKTRQFTLSELFLLTTAFAMVLALRTLERTYGWTQFHEEAGPGTYSSLSVYPWYDRVLISLGLVCALYVALAALCQVFRSAVAKLRGLREN